MPRIASADDVTTLIADALIRLGDQGVEAHERARAIGAAYREPHRVYHDHHHLLTVLDTAASLLEAHPVDETDGAAAVIALAYHDIVYEIGSPDNEERSAQVLLSQLQPRLPADRQPLLQDIAGVIRGTRRHQVESCTADWQRAVFDADLATLGGTPDEYDRYVDRVRREYADAVTDAQWKTGRSAFLRAMVERRTLYGLPASVTRWDAGARANLRRELHRLESGG